MTKIPIVPTLFPEEKLSAEDCGLLQGIMFDKVIEQKEPKEIHICIETDTYRELGALACGSDAMAFWVKKSFDRLEFKEGAKVVVGDYKDLLRSAKVLLRVEGRAHDLKPEKILEIVQVQNPDWGLTSGQLQEGQNSPIDSANH